MIHLDFEINKCQLLLNTLKRFYEPIKDWNKEKYKLWQKNKIMYYLFSGMAEVIYITESREKVKITNKSINNYLKLALKSKSFKKLFKDTEVYLERVKNQWLRNEGLTNELVKNITKIKFPNRTIKVLITHPYLYNGRSFPEHNTIIWGHTEDWQNYSTIYLWHETMHILTYKRAKTSDLFHAIIELAIDNELRTKLNRRNVYFKEGRYKVGHPSLKELEKKILPFWKKFLREKKNQDIFEFEKKLMKIFSKKSYKVLDTPIKKWAEWH